MLLMKISQYREEHFVEGSRPAINTLKKWIDNGDLNGKVIGGNYYVQIDESEGESVNELVEKALSYGTQTQKTRQKGFAG